MNAEEIAVRMRTGRMVAKQKQTDRQIRWSTIYKNRPIHTFLQERLIFYEAEFS